MRSPQDDWLQVRLDSTTQFDIKDPFVSFSLPSLVVCIILRQAPLLVAGRLPASSSCPA